MKRNWNEIMVFITDLLKREHPMTLRQVHYRVVSNQNALGWGYDNTQSTYKGLSAHVVKARWAGTISWEWIVDETRQFSPPALDCEDARAEVEWAGRRLRQLLTSPPSVVVSPWAWQPECCLFLLEKNALAGVLKPVVQEPNALAVCRGFASASYLYRVSRWAVKVCRSRNLHLFVLTDHDPSGHSIAKSAERTLEKHGVQFASKTRLALTREQIQQFNLPGVPAKASDSRSRTWSGGDVVELDALPPAELRALVREVQASSWDADVAAAVERLQRAVNRRAARSWERERERVTRELR